MTGDAHSRTIVVNATNIGRYLDGIGTYSLNVVRELARVKGDTRFIIYVNRAARDHVSTIRFGANSDVRFIGAWVSPDHGFPGHFLRLLCANILGLRHRKSLIFTTSQLEAVFFRRNQILTIHDVIPLLFRKTHKKQYYYFKYMLPPVLRRVRKIITPSRHTKEMLERCYGVVGAKVSVIYNGVDRIAEEVERAARGDREEIILYSGRITPVKNVAGILRAFTLVIDKMPHKLVITGHGSSQVKRELRKKVVEYGIPSDRVVYLGYVSRKELVGWMRRASIFVFPSFHEGFGMPPLEAMALGCPVIVSNAASLPEVCGDAAYYIDPHDPDSIARGMCEVVRNSRLRAMLIEKGRRRANGFRWWRAGREHAEVLNGALYAKEEGSAAVHW